MHENKDAPAPSLLPFPSPWLMTAFSPVGLMDEGAATGGGACVGEVVAPKPAHTGLHAPPAVRQAFHASAPGVASPALAPPGSGRRLFHPRNMIYLLHLLDSSGIERAYWRAGLQTG